MGRHQNSGSSCSNNSCNNNQVYYYQQPSQSCYSGIQSCNGMVMPCAPQGYNQCNSSNQYVNKGTQTPTRDGVSNISANDLVDQGIVTLENNGELKVNFGVGKDASSMQFSTARKYRNGQKAEDALMESVSLNNERTDKKVISTCNDTSVGYQVSSRVNGDYREININLQKGVTRFRIDISGSTYVVDRAEIEAAIASKGERAAAVEIAPPPPPAEVPVAEALPKAEEANASDKREEVSDATTSPEVNGTATTTVDPTEPMAGQDVINSPTEPSQSTDASASETGGFWNAVKNFFSSSPSDLDTSDQDQDFNAAGEAATEEMPTEETQAVDDSGLDAAAEAATEEMPLEETPEVDPSIPFRVDVSSILDGDTAPQVGSGVLIDNPIAVENTVEAAIPAENPFESIETNEVEANLDTVIEISRRENVEIYRAFQNQPKKGAHVWNGAVAHSADISFYEQGNSVFYTPFTGAEKIEFILQYDKQNNAYRQVSAGSNRNEAIAGPWIDAAKDSMGDICARMSSDLGLD